MKKARRHLELTVNGKSDAALLVAAAHQEIASHLDVVASIRRGLAEARRGSGRTADEVFDELNKKTRRGK